MSASTAITSDIVLEESTDLVPVVQTDPASLIAYTEMPSDRSTIVSGAITTNTVWTIAGSPYVLNNDLTIGAAVTLTLEAGVIVKSNTNVNLVVNGRLQSLGTQGNPVVFTSLRDDERGGDTNNDGNATAPAAANWSGIYVPANSRFTGMSNVVMAYSDYGLYLDYSNSGANITLSGNQAIGNRYNGVRVRGTISGTLALDLTDQSNFPIYLIDDITIRDGSVLQLSEGTIVKAGANVNFVVNGDLQPQGTAEKPVIFTSIQDDERGGDTNNDGNATAPAAANWSGIYVPANSDFTDMRNTLIAYSDYSLYLDYNNSGADIMLAGNQAIGNRYNGVRVRGTISGTLSLNLTSQSNFPVYLFDDITIRDTGVMSLSAGTIVKAGSNVDLYVYGQLRSEGTAQNPVVFTSIHDDARGGDTNNNSDTTSPAAANWGGIYVPVNSSFSGMTNALIAYSDYSLWFDYTNSGGAITLSGIQADSNRYNGVRVRGTISGTLAINLTNQSSFPVYLFDDITIRDTGVMSLSAGTIVKAGSNVDLYVYGQLRSEGTAQSPVVFTSIHDDARGGDTNNNSGTTTPAAANWGGIYAPANSSFSGMTNTLIAYSDYSLWFDYTNSGGAITLSGMQADSNRYNGVRVRGTISGTLAINLTNQSSFPVYLFDDITIRNTGVMSLSAGTIVKAGPNVDLYVYGQLRSEGTTQNPVVFTSIHDDARGGDTNNSDTTSPAAANWGGIYAPVNSSFSGMTNTLIAYSDYSLYLDYNNSGADITLSGNQAIGNRYNGVRVRGTISGTLSLDLTNQSNFPVYLLSDITIRDTGVMSLSAGTIVKAGSNVDIFVYGDLKLQGTAADPVVFTSIQDDARGGDTNNNGTASAPATENWGGISFVHSPNRNRTIRHVFLAYGSYGLGFGNVGSSADITVEDNQFEYVNSAPINFVLDEASGLIATSGNRATSNALNAIGIRGTVAGRLSLQTAGMADGLSVNLYDDIIVQQSGTLILSPGTILKGSNPTRNNYDDILVYGSLVARGTEALPIVFTSIRDNEYGAIYNEAEATPEPRDWGGIYFYQGSDNNVLHNCLIAYAYRNIYIETNDISVTSCVTRHSSDAGIYVTGNTSPQRLAANDIISNTGRGLTNAGTSTVNAAFNWWGDPSGPYHVGLNPEGSGNTAVGDVIIAPWLTGKDLSAVSLTENDYTRLVYNATDNTYTRIYPSGDIVHFNADGSHDYTQSPDGHRLRYLYNPGGTVSAMTFTLVGESTPRYTWTFSYGDGQLTAITDPAGQVTEFILNDLQQLTSVRFGDGTERRFLYGNTGLLLQRWDEDNNSWRYQYDAYGRIDRHISPPRPVYNAATGAVTIISEEREFAPGETGYPLINESSVGSPDTPAPAVPKSADLVTGVTFGRGAISGRTNRWGAWMDLTDAIGRTTAFERDAANRITRLDEPNGDCTEYTYDAVGNVLSSRRMSAETCTQTSEVRDTSAIQNWRYTYESRFNRIQTETDPLGFTTRYIYDYEEGVSEAGRLIRIEYPAITIDGGGQVTPTVRYSYNSLGLMETMTDEAGITTRYSYDNAGRLTQMIENEGGLNLTTRFQDFDAAGRPQTVIAPRNNISRYTYDSWGRVLTITDPLGVVTSYEYDGRGNVIRTTDDDTVDESSGRNLVTNYSYDADDRLLSEQTTGDNMRWSDAYSYDINGNLATHTDSEGQTTTFTYDAANQLTGIEDPLNQTTGFTYTAKSELATITQANGEEIRFGYDAFGNLAALTPPDRPAHSFDYSLRDETTAYTPPDAGIGATETGYTYDALGLLTGETRPDGRTIRYAYDNALRLSRLTQPRGDTTYAYNPTTDQLTGIAAPEGVTLSYGYDKELLTSVAWSGPLNGTVNYGYDDRYRLTSLAVNGVNTIAYAYDSSSFLTKAGDLAIERLPQSRALDGTSLNQVTDSYGYDSFGKLTRYQASAGGSMIYELRYSYDALDRIATQTETIGGSSTAYAYNYDAVGRLIGVTANGATVTFTYDGNGNRLTGPDGAAGSYDTQDRMLSYGGASYTYTANGELLTKVENGQTTTYDYDVFSNLMAVTLPDGTQIEYLIDGMDRRIGRKVNGTLEQGWLYQDQLEPVAELDGSGNVVSRFVYATRDHVPDYMIKGGTTYRIISDHLGSVHLVVNTATGAIAQQMNYDEFGRVIQDTNPGFQPFGFAGGLYDRDTGLVRFGARDYNAETGRWTTKDSIGFEGGDTNLYVYAGNDPVNYIDPAGDFAFLIPILVGAALGAAVDFGIQLWENDWNIECVDPWQVALEAGLGAVPFGSAVKAISRVGRYGTQIAKSFAGIKTPYGIARQSLSRNALTTRGLVNRGATLYRGGKLGRSAGPEGQFWSLENPLTPGYAQRFGIPSENVSFDFVETATLRPGANFITRPAPGVGTNGGGAIEVVVNPGDVRLSSWHMP